MGLEAILILLPGAFQQIFIPNIPWRLLMKYSFNSLDQVIFEEEKFEQVEFEWSWKKRSIIYLTLCCHKSSCTHLFDYMYELPFHRLQQYLRNLV